MGIHGGTHPRVDRYEARRSFRLQALGYRVIRFSDMDMDMDAMDKLGGPLSRAGKAAA